MSIRQPYYYWAEAFLWTTSNVQFDPVDGTTIGVAAERENDDSYVRSEWSAQFSYYSPGTSTAYGWWMGARVLLVISNDPQALVAPVDIGGESPLTLGYVRLVPHWYPIKGTANSYGVVWSTGAEPFRLKTGRSYVDAGHRPQVNATIFASDQYGIFSGLESSAGAARVQIDGRVLWASTNNGL